MPPESFAAVLRETDATACDPVDDGASTVLVLGQYLSALGLMTAAEEIDLQKRLIDRAAQWAPQRIVFKPHPAAPPLVTAAVRGRAAAHGIEFVEYSGPLAAELLAERLDAVAVVAGFSTALPTVHTLFGRAIGSAGNDTILAALTPFENSNRIPATLVDALTREGSPYADPARLQLLIDAVGYAMQPEIAGHLRGRAEELLRGLDRMSAIGTSRPDGSPSCDCPARPSRTPCVVHCVPPGEWAGSRSGGSTPSARGDAQGAPGGRYAPMTTMTMTRVWTMDEQKPRTVAIIPARGGSKQVPRKNLQRVGGVPLVERAVRAAAAASGIDLVVVSTDDDEIAAVATAAGARVIRRPAELAGDTATSESALLHALDELEARGDSVGIVAFLQATSPFIPSDALAAAVEEIRADRADSVFAAHETYGFLWREDDRGDAVAINHEAAHRPRRQDREPHHFETGASLRVPCRGLPREQASLLRQDPHRRGAGMDSDRDR